MNIERGEILLVEFDPTRGSEIKKTRPAVVVTNNLANRYSPVIAVVPITSQQLDRVRVFEVLLKNNTGLNKASKAVIAQMRTIDKSRIQKKIGKVADSDMTMINEKLKIHFDLE
jgi:mRNA interferase MazF